MTWILVFIFFAAVLGGGYWYYRLISNNEKKIVEVLEKFRLELGSSGSVFPIITRRPDMPRGQNDQQPFATRTVIDFKQKWEVYKVTPAGVQRHFTLEPNELTVKLSKNTGDYRMGLNLSDPVGFISPSYILASEPVALFPPKKNVEDIQKLAEEFRSKGATIA
jgi:hypothetical protein